MNNATMFIGAGNEILSNFKLPKFCSTARHALSTMWYSYFRIDMDYFIEQKLIGRQLRGEREAWVHWQQQRWAKFVSPKTALNA
jgi:hypothetical protein